MASEWQFAHDEELKFKSEARRHKLLGFWAADKLRFQCRGPRDHGERHPRDDERIARGRSRANQGLRRPANETWQIANGTPRYACSHSRIAALIAPLSR